MGRFLPTVGVQGDCQTSTHIPSGMRYIRLISLKRWQFSSVDPEKTFVGLVRNLDTGPFQIPAMQGPSAGENKSQSHVDNALRMGYTAINHNNRLGDKTVSWFRGPLLPCHISDGAIPIPDPSKSPVREPLLSADEALRYDPETGMLDVSYAAAWQIGRLLALQNKHFASALFKWKQENSRKTSMYLERKILLEKLGSVLSMTGNDALNTETVHAAATQHLVGEHLDPVISGEHDK
jgi:hypothetical protein